MSLFEQTYDLAALTGLKEDDRIHDTSEITEIYFQRPAHMLTLSLGLWFCKAHGLFDADMKLSASSQLTKKYMWMRGYTKFPLDPLLAFNKTKEEIK